MTTIPLLDAYPLTISLDGRCFTLSGVDEAVRVLEEHWPNKTGVHYAQALRSCRLAVLRVVSSAVAREHLMAACLEAGVPHEIRPSTERDQLPLLPSQKATPIVVDGERSRMSICEAETGERDG